MIRFIFLLLLSLNAQALQLLQPKEANNTVKQKLSAEQVLSAKQLLTQLKKGAKSGNVRSQFSLANMYYHGINIRKDVKLAFYWYSQVAELGYPTAQFNLAEFYYNGINIPKNLNQAIFWYEKAAQQDFINAQYKLARIYHFEKNIKNAQYWYERAAKLGSSPAQFNLARLYEKKVGFDKNLKLAQYWYEKAAIQSNAEAQYYLADFFERTAKPMQALLMYQKSAEQGFSKAQSRLARRRTHPILNDSKKSIVDKVPNMREIARSLSENSKALKNTTKALMHNATQDKPATQKVLKQ
ncbi:hypothetical protein [uncultured Gammaproteobacteria bacterium]|nr:hypothetical protein [uncultured Gammaproteobacteria bacterium]